MKIGQYVKFTWQSPAGGPQHEVDGLVVSFDSQVVCIAVREEDGIGGFKTELKFVARSVFDHHLILKSRT